MRKVGLANAQCRCLAAAISLRKTKCFNIRLFKKIILIGKSVTSIFILFLLEISSYVFHVYDIICLQRSYSTSRQSISKVSLTYKDFRIVSLFIYAMAAQMYSALSKFILSISKRR